MIRNKERNRPKVLELLRQGINVVMQELLKHGANPLAIDKHGNNVMHVASRHGNADILSRALNSKRVYLSGMDAMDIRNYSGEENSAWSRDIAQRSMSFSITSIPWLVLQEGLVRARCRQSLLIFHSKTKRVFLSHLWTNIFTVYVTLSVCSAVLGNTPTKLHFFHST